MVESNIKGKTIFSSGCYLTIPSMKVPVLIVIVPYVCTLCCFSQYNNLEEGGGRIWAMYA